MGTGRGGEPQEAAGAGRSGGVHRRGEHGELRGERALSRTGPSSSSPATRSGARTATRGRRWRLCEPPPTTARGADVVEQCHHLLGEGVHGVRQRVGGRVPDPPCPSGVEDQHAARRRRGCGRRGRAAARHQERRDEDDPGLPAPYAVNSRRSRPRRFSRKYAPTCSEARAARPTISRSARPAALDHRGPPGWLRTRPPAARRSRCCGCRCPINDLARDLRLDVRRREGVAARGQRVLGVVEDLMSAPAWRIPSTNAATGPLPMPVNVRSSPRRRAGPPAGRRRRCRWSRRRRRVRRAPRGRGTPLRKMSQIVPSSRRPGRRCAAG